MEEWAEEPWGLLEALAPVNRLDADTLKPIAPRDMSLFPDKADNVCRNPWQPSRQFLKSIVGLDTDKPQARWEILDHFPELGLVFLKTPAQDFGLKSLGLARLPGGHI